MGRSRGKVHFQQISTLCDDRSSALARVETDALLLPFPAGKQDKSARQRCVSAKGNFRDRRKPPEVETLFISDQEGRLGQIVLRGDCLHRAFAELVCVQHNRERIAGARAFREDVDDVERTVHRIARRWHSGGQEYTRDLGM
jgi:hypothetical protein